MTETPSGPLYRLHRGAQGPGGTCGGWLIVEPGHVRFEVDRPDRWIQRGLSRTTLPAVVHANAPLVLKRARLLPPGINSGLVVAGPEGVITVLTWGLALEPLRRAVREAGVELVERRTWVSIGIGEAHDRPR